MCGIIGYVGRGKNCVRVLIDGLERLEYRGYDSAGIAFIKNNDVVVIKKEGKISNLKKYVDFDVKSNLGIGHTRWATHGRANSDNAHPHRVGKITIIHNGIVENYDKLRCDLKNKGYDFKSETDSEVVAALIDFIYKSEKDMLKTIKKVEDMLIGSYALGIICDDEKDVLYAVKNKSPLIIGVGDAENYIASDVPAILDKTKKYIALDDGVYARITKSDIKLYLDGEEKKLKIDEFSFDENAIDKQGYEHFMLKEMHEQPEVFKKTVEKYISGGINSLIRTMPDFSKYGKIRIVACGSATHAGLIGKQMIERYADVEVMVDTASEFRYCKQFLKEDELVIVISQSGETADTLEALNIAKKFGNDTLGIVNAKGSTIAREADMVLYTEAGQEIAVATTKAYSAQVALLSLIAVNLSYRKNLISNDEIGEILNDVKRLPDYIEELLNRDYKKIAQRIVEKNDIFFIGRGIDYALAEEGSLKLKEISYTHSEAYAAGELKHGTISLIEDGVPVFAIITDDNIALKTISNVKEVKSRGADVICVTNYEGLDENVCDEKVVIPKVHYLFEPLLTVIPLQMIAYEVAKLKGCSIDKPKNLAKSVTVE